MRSIARLGFCSLLACSAAGAIALACDDALDLPDLPSLDLDSGPLPTVPVMDASIADAAEPDADAGPPDPLAPFLGIWRGTGFQGDQQWTILVDVHGGPRGELVGVMTYPSLGCGGTLVRLEDADGGADAGRLDSGLDASLPAVVLREEVSAGTCVPVGDDQLTLLEDGGLGFHYRVLGASDVDAHGTLTRVGERSPAQAPPIGIWTSGAPDGNHRWPMLATVSRTDLPGAAVGVFARAVDGSGVCGGLWTLGAAGAGTLTVQEVFEDGNIACPAPATVTLSLQGDGGLATARVDGTGADAGFVVLAPR